MEAPAQGKLGILVDRSHGQQNWQLPFVGGRADRVLQLSNLPPSSAKWDLRAIDQKTQIDADQLKVWRGLIFAIPHNMPIDEATRAQLVRWVRQGGRLVLLGFELGVRHHRTNLNELAGDFGLRFNSDIVAAKDHQPPENPYEKPIDFGGIASQHPLFQGVNSLRLRNLCTLTVEPGADILLTLGEHSIGWLQTGVPLYQRCRMGAGDRSSAGGAYRPGQCACDRNMAVVGEKRQRSGKFRQPAFYRKPFDLVWGVRPWWAASVPWPSAGRTRVFPPFAEWRRQAWL
jgi:hypothetical protein